MWFLTKTMYQIYSYYEQHFLPLFYIITINPENHEFWTATNLKTGLSVDYPTVGKEKLKISSFVEKGVCSYGFSEGFPFFDPELGKQHHPDWEETKTEEWLIDDLKGAMK